MFGGYAKTTVKMPGYPEMELKEVLGELPEELKPLADEVQSRFEKVSKDAAQGHYDIGKLLKEQIAAIEAEYRAQQRSTYGLHIFDRLAVVVDVHPRVLRDCVGVAETFTPEEFQTSVVDRGLG